MPLETRAKKWSRKRSSIKESDMLALNFRISTIRKLRPRDDQTTTDAAMVWQRKSSGYRIVDLRLNRFMQALNFILTYYCSTEPLCAAVGLYDDAVSMKVFMNMVFKQMEGMIGFCAVREGTNDIVGVLIATIFDKSQWYIKKDQGDTLRQIMMLRNYVTVKSLFYGTTNADKSLCIDVLCVKPNHRNNGVGTALLRSCVVRASNFATVCVGQFTSGAAQTIAKRLNFEIVYELPYEDLGKRKFEVFKECQHENYSIACMVVRMSPPRVFRPSIAEKPAIEPKKVEKEK